MKTEERGLAATYWGGSNFGGKQTDNKETDKSKINFSRKDGTVKFDFGETTPNDELFNPDQFSVRWEGSLIVEETGEYEIVLKTQNGARLFLNQIREVPLINAWVSSGNEVREEKISIFLLGGRTYPIRLDYFKYKERTGSIELAWKTPNGVMETIPQRNLSPEKVNKETFTLQNTFPPDDLSDGYERGTTISKEWLTAVNEGALEAGDYAQEYFQRYTGCKPGEEAGDEGAKKVSDFVRKFASLVWNQPVPDEVVDELLDSEFTPAGLKKAVVRTFTSPKFLYPDLRETDATPSQVMAGRMAIAMWDSLPDKELWKAAQQGKLETQDQVRAHAHRMLEDPRTRDKLSGFFHHWLELKDLDTISKDPKQFPGFVKEVFADLRKSLDLFTDHVAWETNSDYRQLLTADYMFLNDRLAPIYGKSAEGTGFQKVSFEGGARSESHSPFHAE